jgi:hypothetical protein
VVPALGQAGAGDGLPVGWHRPVFTEIRPDPAFLHFLYELGEIAAAGGDIRSRLFPLSASLAASATHRGKAGPCSGAAKAMRERV